MVLASFNFNLPGYEFVEELHHDSKTIVFRANQSIDQPGLQIRPVVIKLLSSEYPTDQDLLNFRHQYGIAKNLDLPGIVRIYSLEKYGRGYALVMEDLGDICLAKYCQIDRLALADVLIVAIQLAETLHALCQQRIIHKDLKPANLLINPTTKQVRLIDFSISSQLPRETTEIFNANLLEGTLAYLSPEQTGRMNRGIDYRTDFYALGVTLYELLAGRLPFQAQEPIELIHCHLAQTAVPLHSIDPALPQVVSQIVAKLMAKNAEDRYQSGLGLKYDLEQCLYQWQTTGAISEFPLGQQDFSDRFIIPERLYGRQVEVQTLLNAFDRVANGSGELMLVAGCSGIGKTAVIDEIHKPIVKQRGYFIEGKYDQFNRNIPFSALVRAFRDLIGQLLSESDDRLARWKSQILAAVGEHGRVIIAAIPELEYIIGKQPPVSELSGAAAQEQFNTLLRKFIKVFTTAEHPLVIFLDDLQWADSASLLLIKLLMADNGYLLLLGAYRNNEVSPAHPLMLTVTELQQMSAIVGTITLTALQGEDIDRLVADTLHCARDRSQPLTELIARKTQGNPFFITQFLKALYTGGAIWFKAPSHRSAGGWECDMVRVQALAFNDDVVEFMVAQLQKLPQATQRVLKLAACIGNQFDLGTLAIVSEQSQLATAKALWSGLQAELILPTSQIYKFFRSEILQQQEDTTAPAEASSHNPEPTPSISLEGSNVGYRFVHDRVQQAAYCLIPADRQQQTHLQIGRLLLANTPDHHQSERLFEIVNHFNLAIDLLQMPAERQILAELNLRAARKAKSSTAYAASFRYGQIGMELLGEVGWEQNYQLVLALSETAAQVAFLNGDFEVIPPLVKVVLDRVTVPLDRVKTYETMIQLYIVKKQYQQAIDCGLEILQQLGINLSPQPHRIVLLGELTKTRMILLGKSNQKLLNLPEITDSAKIAPFRILDLLLMPSYFSSQNLLVLLGTVGVQLTLRHGNTPWSASFYGTYSLILSSLGDLKRSYQIGKLTLMLADRFSHPVVTAKVKVIIPWFSQPWQEDLHDSLPILDDSIQVAMDSGNLTYMGLGAYLSTLARFYLGLPLAELDERMLTVVEILNQSRDESSQQLLGIYYQTVCNLQVAASAPYNLVTGDDLDEVELIAKWTECGESPALSTLYALKTFLAYLFGDITTALGYADAQLPYEYSETSCYPIALTWMFDALTRLAAYPQSDDRLKQQLLRRVAINRRKLGKRARLMPSNFQHQYDLVAAEHNRVLGKYSEAMDLYDCAIAGAKVNGYIREEALGNELAAKFYLQWGKPKVAATYMQEAYYCYDHWGATAKTADLEKFYPRLLTPILQSPSDFNPLATLAMVTYPLVTTGHSSQEVNSFDLAAVIQSAQSLSSAIELEELIQQLSQIILQNSGAETCLLVLPANAVSLQDDSYQEWQVRSLVTVNPDDWAPLSLPQRLVNDAQYPANLIYWIKNNRQSVIFDARKPLEIATACSASIDDQYLLEHQPQSVFCLPILKQGTVLGVLYLEHRHAPNIFTDNHKTVISFLCTQAAIALENAQLYQESQDAAEEIRLKQSRLETLLHDRKEMELALRDSETRYAHLVSNVPVTLYQFEISADGSSRMNYLSARFLEMFELPAADVLANIAVLTDRLFPADRDTFAQSVQDSAASGQPWTWEGRWLMNNGDFKWIRGESIQIASPADSIIWDGILIDITDRKQAEISLSLTNDRLDLTNQELIRATRLKDEFLATMSHELRTPLNAILGMSEALQEEILGSLNPQQIKSLATIERSGHHLLSLINDILDVSKIAAGKLELDLAPTDINHLCQSSLVFVKQQAFDKQIQLDLQLPPQADPINIDERRMRQVLINLLSNAVKFTPPSGRVVLGVSHPTTGDDLIDRSWINFTVTDTGIGIATDDLGKLFQPFVQLDSNLNRQYEGTGLGLTLVKQIAELHGGSVTIESELGQGSCFTIRLPQTCPVFKPASCVLPPLPDQPIQPADENAASSLILLVEDNEANITTFSSYLHAKGYRTILAGNGYQAIELAQNAAPDLILMDIQMPQMDGLEAITCIRQDSKLATIPIIALTALAMEGDRDRCMAAGANDYLTKPVKLKQLNLKIQEWLDRN